MMTIELPKHNPEITLELHAINQGKNWKWGAVQADYEKLNNNTYTLEDIKSFIKIRRVTLTKLRAEDPNYETPAVKPVEGLEFLDAMDLAELKDIENRCRLLSNNILNKVEAPEHHPKLERNRHVQRGARFWKWANIKADYEKLNNTTYSLGEVKHFHSTQKVTIKQVSREVIELKHAAESLIFLKRSGGEYQYPTIPVEQLIMHLTLVAKTYKDEDGEYTRWSINPRLPYHSNESPKAFTGFEINRQGCLPALNIPSKEPPEEVLSALSTGLNSSHLYKGEYNYAQIDLDVLGQFKIYFRSRNYKEYLMPKSQIREE